MIKTDRFKFSFFPHCASEWKALDQKVQNAPSINTFKKSLLHFIRPSPAHIYGIHNAYGLKLLTRLRLGLSHLREHKFHHNFNDTFDPFCLCRTNSIETVEHYLLHCPVYTDQRLILFNSLRDKSIYITPYSTNYTTLFLLYGDDSNSKVINKIILSCTIEYIIQSKRFDKPFM